jgi:hypothetical protein
MKNNKLLKSTSILMIASIAWMSSCKDEEKISARDTQDVTEEAVTDTYFQDMDDMAGVAVQSDAATNGRLADGRTGGRIGGREVTGVITDDRFKCSGATVTIVADLNSTTPKGVITVNFGTTGCHDLRGNTRTGKLFFTYNGKRFVNGSTIVITGENYTINGIKIEGTRTLTNLPGSTAEAPKFNVTLAGGKATFQDGTSATRESSITMTWVRGTTVADDKLVVDQNSNAHGTTRGGRQYVVSLLKELEFKRSCGIAVSGTKKYVIDGTKEVTIDYGDGTCDKTVTITLNGITRTITAN